LVATHPFSGALQKFSLFDSEIAQLTASACMENCFAEEFAICGMKSARGKPESCPTREAVCQKPATTRIA